MVNSNGSSIYGYVFRRYQNSTMKTGDDSDHELLLSGALKAINILLEEFTGMDDELREIKMEQTTIIVHKINSDLSALLITNYPTKSDRITLQAFVKNLLLEFDSLPTHTISEAEEMRMGSVVSRIFGSNYTTLVEG